MNINATIRSTHITLGLLLLCCSQRVCRTEEPPQAAQDSTHQYTNSLIRSTSPYLLQHAHNPVDWLPWGPEAFAKAKAENKPIFVSIGYSTCYWCHVMERESFEKEEVAEILNEHYIAIKVDREERPDIDEQLMMATQLLSGRGGWPNSVWLTTDGRPWMAGTYFPREQFKDALLKLAEIWRTQPGAVEKQAASLSAAIRQASTLEVPGSSASAAVLDSGPLDKALAELQQIFDEQQGGFGTQPKFPPHGVLRLLALAAGGGNEDARSMLTQTLDAMWCGGIHDHVGGGFHRYSTDSRWLLPHFEKMLYDNAQLMRAYTEAFVVTGKPLYRRAAEDIFQWLQREMTDAGGAFFSAIDSESEGGEEGRFYTWSMAELNAVLQEQDARIFAEHYNFHDEGNFTEEATGERPGTNIPHLRMEQLGTATNERLSRLRAKLLEARGQREYPHLDDKILTSWNGLMISALARAGVVFEEPRYIQAAARAAKFIQAELQEGNDLLRSWREAQANLPGYLNDYAFFTEGLIELYVATESEQWLAAAQQLANSMLERFEDPAHGGFFFTSAEHDELLLRSKNLNGGGNLPVGNGVAVQVLVKLHELTGNGRYGQAAERALRSFTGLMRQSPRQVEHLVLANELFLGNRSEGKQPAGFAEAGQGGPNSTYSDGVISAKLLREYIQAVPGQSFRLAVVIDIAEEYHLYGQTEGESLVQATGVQFVSEADVEIGDPEFPAGKLRQDRVLGRELRIYESQLRILVPISLQNETTDGDIEVFAKLTYQACDDQQCWLPKTVTLKQTVKVSSERSRASPAWSTADD